jgi:hypothetical protein
MEILGDDNGYGKSSGESDGAFRRFVVLVGGLVVLVLSWLTVVVEARWIFTMKVLIVKPTARRLGTTSTGMLLKMTDRRDDLLFLLSCLSFFYTETVV